MSTNILSKPLFISMSWVGKGPPLLPKAQTPQSAGMDLYAHISQPLQLDPGQRKLIPTGVAIALPVGCEAQIRPRSGLALHHGITVLNSPGTIDSDYRGEIKILLIHLGEDTYTISPSERIAQMVIASVFPVEWSLVESLPQTERAEKGFGSTGK